MTNFVFVLIDDETAQQNVDQPVHLKCASAEFDNVGIAMADYLEHELSLSRLAAVVKKVVFDEEQHTAYLRHATPTIHGIYVFPATREEVESGEQVVELLAKYFPEDFGDPPAVH